jgi:hypothetical protein
LKAGSAKLQQMKMVDISIFLFQQNKRMYCRIEYFYGDRVFVLYGSTSSPRDSIIYVEILYRVSELFRMTVNKKIDPINRLRLSLFFSTDELRRIFRKVKRRQNMKNIVRPVKRTRIKKQRLFDFRRPGNSIKMQEMLPTKTLIWYIDDQVIRQ